MLAVIVTFEFAFAGTNPPITATTEDGKKVLLRDDGTWLFDKPVPPNAVGSSFENADVRVEITGCFATREQALKALPRPKPSYDGMLLSSDLYKAIEKTQPFTFSITNKSQRKLLKLETHDGSVNSITGDVHWHVNREFKVHDRFENDLGSIFMDERLQALQPGETAVMGLSTAQAPVEKSGGVKFSVPKGIFGNADAFELHCSFGESSEG